MQVGIRVPSYAWPDLRYEDAVALRDYARRAEDLGFDSLWVVEHLLVAPPIYRVSWLDPLEVLAFLAACTERVLLGTGIVVLPLRHPVMLAKEVASLAMLSGGRLVLGVGPGWYRAEFEALGVDPAERGKRTDEMLEALRLLLSRPAVTFEGRFYQFRELTIEPRPPRLPPIWVAGGSAVDPSSGRPRMPESVLRRIVAQDGWLAGSSGRPEEGMSRDWLRIQEAARAAGRDPRSLTFAHTQFLHLVDAGSRETVRREQELAFARVMGAERSREDLGADYLFGTAEEMVERLLALRALGLQHILLTPLTSDPRQLDLIAERILPRLR
jgi:probable F420-dependent oxidoreductase